MKKNSKKACNWFEACDPRTKYTNVVEGGTLTLSAMNKLFESIKDSPPPTHIIFENTMYKIGSKKFKKVLNKYASR